jgi:hypothetical protein
MTAEAHLASSERDDDRRWTVLGGGPAPAASLPAGSGPPERWREHWRGHSQLLLLAGSTGHAAVHLDPDVPPAAGRRLLPWIDEVWQYATATYGAFGPDPRLHAVIHGGRWSGSHRATYLEASHDHRNAADVGDGSWRSDDGGILDLLNLQVGRIVETASHGVAESPARGIWGDGPWAQMFRYDLHVALGRGGHAEQLAEGLRARVDDSPRPGTHWFRDWFHPLWSDCGRSRVLAGFFEQLAGHFPRAADGSYRRMLTWGEFLHFSSGAAGCDVSGLARRAFGWRSGWDAQLEQARTEFPQVAY